METLTAIAARRLAADGETNQQQRPIKPERGSVYSSRARALVEISNQMRAAIAQLAGKVPRNGSYEMVNAHLKGAVEKVGRIEVLSRRLMRKLGDREVPR